MNMHRIRLALYVLLAGAPFLSGRGGPIITTLPEPDAGGWYEIGVPTAQTGQLSFAHFSELAYVDWAKLQAAGLPDGAKIRFTGGLLFDALPQDRGYVYDFSAASRLAAIKADAFPAGYKLVVPSGAYFRFIGATLTPDYGAGTFTLAKNGTETSRGLLCDLELNGSTFGNDDGLPAFHGALTGTGSITLSNWGKNQLVDGPLDFNGNFIASNQAQGDYFTVKGTNAVSKLKFFQGYMANNPAKGFQGLCYYPARGADDPPCTLEVSTLQSGYGACTGTLGSGVLSQGVGVFLHSGNTLKIGTVYHMDLFIVADTTLDKPTFQKGFANVEIGNYGTSANGTIVVSPNVHLKTGFHWQRVFKADYRIWTNVVNRGSLDVSGTQYNFTSLTVRGFEPANLPRTVKCKADHTGVVTNELSGDVWTMPFDFTGTDPAEWNPARCEAMGVLSAPAAGTVILANRTATPGVPPVAGDYPVMTCTTGGETLADWTVRTEGDWLGYDVEPITGPTGLIVRVTQKPATNALVTVLNPWTNDVYRKVTTLVVSNALTLAGSKTMTVSNTIFDGTESRAHLALTTGTTLKGGTLALTNAGVATVDFAGGQLMRSGFNQRFCDCTHADGRVVFNSVNGEPILLNLSGQNAFLAPQAGVLEMTGRGGVLFRQGAADAPVRLTAACRDRVLWNQQGGIRVNDSTALKLEEDESVPRAKPLDLDTSTARIDFAGKSSTINAIRGLGLLTNSSVTVSIVRFGADNRDLVLTALLPAQVGGNLVFEKSGTGRLTADRPLNAGIALAGGTLVVKAGTRAEPFAPETFTAAAGTTILVDGGALQLPAESALAPDVTIRTVNGGVYRLGTTGKWQSRRGLVIIVRGETAASEEPLDSTSAWRSVGPGGGGYVQTVQPSRHAAERFFVGCDVAGFFRSEDGGRHYRMMNNGLREMWVETIAEHPTDTNTLIIAGHSIYKTTDGGVTWTEKRTGLPAAATHSFACGFSKVVYDPDDANHVYAAAGWPRKNSGYDDKHLFASFDGGETWDEVVAEGQFPEGAYIHDLSVDPRDGRRLAVATPMGVFLSTDAGTNWTESCTGLPEKKRAARLARAPSDPDVLYVTLRQVPGETPYQGGVYRSTDGGATWTAKTKGLGTRTGQAGVADSYGDGYRQIVVDPTDADTVYLGGSTYWSPGIWKTTDGGGTWTKTLAKGAVELAPQGWLPFDGNLDMTISAFGISSFGTHPLYFGTAFGVWRSDDGGLNWGGRYTDPQPDGTFASAGFEIICGTKVQPDPFQRGRVYLSYLDVGAFVSTNNGVTMARHSGNRDLGCKTFALSPTEPGVVWGVFNSDTARRRVMVSRDAMASWSPVVAADAVPDWFTNALPTSIACLTGTTPHKLVCTVPGRGLAFSADDGATWSFPALATLPQGRVPGGLLFRDGRLYVRFAATSTAPGALWRSDDLGATWAPLTEDSLQIGDPVSLDADGTRLLLVARGNYSPTLGLNRAGGLWLSEDDGVSWRRISSAGNANKAIFADRGRIVLGRLNDDYFDRFNDTAGVFWSGDDGFTWQSLKDDTLKNPQIRDLAADPFDRSVIWATTHGNATFVRRLP